MGHKETAVKANMVTSPGE